MLYFLEIITCDPSVSTVDHPDYGTLHWSKKGSAASLNILKIFSQSI